MTILGEATTVTVHRKGYKPDHPAKRDLLRLSTEVFDDSPSFPLAVSNEHLEGSVLDQNLESGCTGHGTSQTLEVCTKKAGIPLPFRASPRSIYANARLLSLPDGAALTDDGAEPIDVVATIASKGVRALVMPGPLGFQSDCDESNVDSLPTEAELAEEHVHLEPGAYRIDVSRPGWIDQLCSAIDKHGAACTGSFVDSAFEAYTPETGPVRTVDLQDPNGGGHWLSVTGYRTVEETGDDHVKFGVPVGERVFTGPNSWGKDWGRAGHYEVTGPVLRKACSDCYGFAVQAAATPSTTLVERICAAMAAVIA